MFGRMRVPFLICICMVHAVKNSVGIRAEVRRTLCYESEDIKKFFPSSAHRKHFMRCVAVQKKCLAEKRKIPVSNEENQNCHKLQVKIHDNFNLAILF